MRGEKVRKMCLFCLLLPKRCCVVAQEATVGHVFTPRWRRRGGTLQQLWFGILSVTCAPTLTWSHHYFLYLLSNINKVCFTHLKLSFDCFFVFTIGVSLVSFTHGEVREKDFGVFFRSSCVVSTLQY